VIGAFQEPHLVEHLVHAAPADAVDGGEQPQVLAPAHRREQRGGLDDRADAAHDVRQATWHIGAEHAHLAGGRTDQSEQASHRGRLARPVGAEEAEHSPGRYREVQTVDRDGGRPAGAPVLLAEPFDLDCRCHRRQPSMSTPQLAAIQSAPGDVASSC
jgi:hypothetical protein